jgi:hypothetical protein
MAGIVDQLPNPSELGELKTSINLKDFSFGNLKDFDLSEMTSSLRELGGGETLSGLSLPELPAGLSKDGFSQTLSQPLDKLKSFNSQTVLGDLGKGALPVNLAAPSFDINTPISTITTRLLPGTTTISQPTFNTDIPELDLSGAIEPLNKLARAGAATPTRLLFMLMRVGQSFAKTITDKDVIFRLTVESLEEIYAQQIFAAQINLPYHAIDRSLRLFGTFNAPQAFTARYKALLDDIETLGPQDVERLKQILERGQTVFVPALNDFDRSRMTLEALYASDPTLLRVSLTNLLNLSGADEVFLKKYFDQIASASHSTLGAIAKPVKQIGDMAGQVEDYLNQAAAKADEVAETVSTQIESNLAKAEEFLKEVQKTIQEVETQIKTFVEKLDVGPLVNKAKLGCAKIGEAVEMFFTKVEEIKLKLDELVQKMATQIETKLSEAFKKAEELIRKLLAKITDILERPEVKDALEQARQGIEKFKTTIEQASLKPAFDLVINKTNQLEGSIKTLNVTQMSTPQKAALKVGVKVIEQVKVDEIIKPELLAAFEQIRQPLAELITLLKEKALQIEQIIYEFNPGTVVNNLIIESEPYKELMRILDEFRPSKLLAPLKQANEFLTDIVRKLDPNILINEVQKIYNKLAGLLEMLDPAPLNRLVGDAVDVAVSMLGKIRDQELDSLIETIKKTISLARLMEKSGLAEIASADFWTLIQDILGGKYLDEINKAIGEVEKQLAALAATLDFSKAQTLLRELIAAVEQQLTADGALLKRRAKELNGHMAKELAELQQLEARRQAILKKPEIFPEVTALLGALNLAPVLQLQPAVAAIAEWEAAPLNAAADKFNDIVRERSAPLKALGAASFQDAAVAIFRKQISEPVAALVAQVQQDLQPFADAIKKIQRILITLTELPAKIDVSVAKVLDTAKESIKKVITQVINSIQTFQQSLANTLNLIYERVKKIVGDLSPYWMLNSFAKSDFFGDQGDEDSTPPGMMALARRIASGADVGGIRVAAVLQAKLKPEQLTLLRSEATDTSTSLQAGNRANVLQAINDALRDRALCSRENVDALKEGLKTQLTEIQAKTAKSVDDIKKSYRIGALLRQLSDGWVAFNSGEDKENAMIRLNRIVLEAAYTADINMSLQSLHPFIVENVAHLYPQETVDRLDKLYENILKMVKELPEKLIRAPLDDAFNKIKAVLKANFDISGIFAVLEIKMDGLDEDLGQGLDRLSLAYNRLLTAFDQKLSAA